MWSKRSLRLVLPCESAAELRIFMRRYDKQGHSESLVDALLSISRKGLLIVDASV